LTAENFFLSAHTLCGLNARPSPEVVSKAEEGAEKVNTSPFDERAAKVSSQHVTFEICESLIECGGRYGSMPVGNAWIGKLGCNQLIKDFKNVRQTDLIR